MEISKYLPSWTFFLLIWADSFAFSAIGYCYINFHSEVCRVSFWGFIIIDTILSSRLMVSSNDSCRSYSSSS